MNFDPVSCANLQQPMKEAIESVAEIVTWCISTLYALSVACNQQPFNDWNSCSREYGIYAVIGILSLSTAEASLCRREPGALSIFRLLLFLLRYPAETSAKERGIQLPTPHRIIAFEIFRTIFSASINFQYVTRVVLPFPFVYCLLSLHENNQSSFIPFSFTRISLSGVNAGLVI